MLPLTGITLVALEHAIAAVFAILREQRLGTERIAALRAARVI